MCTSSSCPGPGCRCRRGAVGSGAASGRARGSRAGRGEGCLAGDGNPGEKMFISYD